MAPKAEAAARIGARNSPRQDRSRARKQALLDAVEEIITTKGLDGLEMREVARVAGLPIASVYHYFPGKAAIVRELATQNYEIINKIIKDWLEFLIPDIAIDQIYTEVDTLIDLISDFFFHTQSVSAIFHASHADADLRLLDAEDTARNAQLLNPLITYFIPSESSVDAMQITCTFLEMVTTPILMAASGKNRDQRENVISSLKLLVRSALIGLYHQSHVSR